MHAYRFFLLQFPVCVLQMKELNHDNIQSFVGACVEPGTICYLVQCCSRGTVQVSDVVTIGRSFSVQISEGTFLLRAVNQFC